MAKQCNIGILGAGQIGGVMADTLSHMSEARAYAVAARDGAKAAAFATQFGVEKSYGSYEEMLRDPAVQLVYIATPHSHHYEHAKLCLAHGKHVLCEKAFTVNARQAQELFALAKEKQLLVAEAIWPRYMPFFKTIRELLDGGVLGTVTSLHAKLGFPIHGNERMRNPALAGGALLDLGVYTLNFAMIILGSAYESISSSAVMYETGVDAQESITLTYPGGAMAVLHSTMVSYTGNSAVIYGTDGYMALDSLNKPQTVTVYNADNTVREVYHAPEQISGYEHEVSACVNAVRAGKTECPDMPWSETLHVMRTMDKLRADWGLRYETLE